MRRLFLRVYLSVALVLMAAVAGSLVILGHAFRSDLEHRLAASMEPMIEATRMRLANSGGPPPFPPERMMRSLNRFRPYPVRLESLSAFSFSEKEMKRMDEGEILFANRNGERLAFAKVSEQRLMVMGPLFERPDQARRLFAAALLAMLVLIGVVMFLLLRPLERRIHTLAETAKSFGRGRLGSRAPEGYDDALDGLGRNFNWMADRIEGLIDNQKEMLRAVSHELRTPLARLFFVLDDAQAAATAEDKDRCLAKIERSLNDMNELVDELLVLARLDSDTARAGREPLQTEPMLRAAADMAADLRRDVAVHLRAGGSRIEGSRRYVKRAMRNLVANAVRHARSDVWISDRLEKDAWLLTVEDDGDGVPPDKRDRVFEPFYRVDESRSARLGGSGLGLAIVRRVMDWHEGQVWVDDSPDHGGARFTLRFPRNPE